MEGWTFLTNHSHVLLSIAADPEIRLKDVAEKVGITERAAQRIVADLIEAGYLTSINLDAVIDMSFMLDGHFVTRWSNIAELILFCARFQPRRWCRRSRIGDGHLASGTISEPLQHRVDFPLR